MGSAEADSWARAVDGAGKDVSRDRDASGKDPEGDSVSCGLALEVPPEPTDAGVLETSSELARAGPGSSWSAGASTDIDELEMGSTEADSCIGVVDGAGKGVSGDASAPDSSGRAEFAPWTDGMELEAQFVVMSAAATAECTWGFSESSTFADAETTTAALRFWMRVEFYVRVNSYERNGSERTCSESSGLRLR